MPPKPEPLFVPDAGDTETAIATRPAAALAEMPQPLADTDTDPMAMMARMIQAGEMTGEKVAAMNALADLKHKLDDRAAREAYYAAIGAFKAEAPVVVKSDKGHHGNFASLDNIEDKIADKLAKHGLAYTFPIAQMTGPGMMKIFCRVSHRLGYFEDAELPMPVPNDMRGVNESQKFGAANSYAKRYCLCNALGIRVRGEDTDGHGLQATSEVTERAMTCITFEQSVALGELFDTMPAPDAERSKFLAWASQAAGREITKLGEIPAGFYPQALSAVKNKAEQFRAAKKG